MFLRRRASDTVEDAILVEIPFINVRLQSGNKQWEATIENHFIGQLEPADKIVLLSRKLEPPKNNPLPRAARKYNPHFSGAYEAVDELYVAYTSLIQGEAIKETSIIDDIDEDKPFYRRYLESELRRFLFGGFGQKPPKPTPVRVRFDKMLKHLYESILFPEGRKPSILHYEHYMVVFKLVESEPPVFHATSNDFTTYAKILSGLVKKGKIKP